VSELYSDAVVWAVVSDWAYALGLWFSVRLVGLWTNMVQNYWTHDRRFGARRYHDDDNAMNIGDWLPVTATFSACLQNNHHHHPQFLRLSPPAHHYALGLRVRLRLPDGAAHEGPGSGEGVAHRRSSSGGPRAERSRVLARAAMLEPGEVLCVNTADLRWRPSRFAPGVFVKDIAVTDGWE